MLNVSPKMLKHIAMVGTLVAFTWMGTALSQTATPTSPSPSTNPGTPSVNPSPNLGPTGGQTDTMEHYLTNHPEIADELHNNPSLINNPQWLAQHPQVNSWMNKHPDVKQDALRNPDQFVNHTERETVEKDHQALNGTDKFLSTHPEVANQLKNNPSLIDNAQFRASHPQLDNYLKQNPGVADEWKNHPEWFTKAAEANAHYNKTGQRPRVNSPTAKK